MNDARIGDAHEQIADGRRIQDARVVQDDECHVLVAQAMLLRFGGQLVHQVASTGLILALMREHVRSEHPAMRAHSAERKHLLLQQPDEMRPGHVQQVGRLLGGQLGVHRENGDGVPVRHLAEDFEKELEGLPG